MKCDQTTSVSNPQIEDIVTRIQDEKAGGVAIRTVKSFLSKIPSVVSGLCLCKHHHSACVCVFYCMWLCVIVHLHMLQFLYKGLSYLMCC